MNTSKFFNALYRGFVVSSFILVAIVMVGGLTGCMNEELGIEETVEGTEFVLDQDLVRIDTGTLESDSLITKKQLVELTTVVYERGTEFTYIEDKGLVSKEGTISINVEKKPSELGFVLEEDYSEDGAQDFETLVKEKMEEIKTYMKEKATKVEGAYDFAKFEYGVATYLDGLEDSLEEARGERALLDNDYVSKLIEEHDKRTEKMLAKFDAIDAEYGDE